MDEPFGDFAFNQEFGQAGDLWGSMRRYGACGVWAWPHAFRHLKASTLLNRGASLSEVQDMLGHADPNTMKRIYTMAQASGPTAAGLPRRNVGAPNSR